MVRGNGVKPHQQFACNEEESIYGHWERGSTVHFPRQNLVAPCHMAFLYYA